MDGNCGVGQQILLSSYKVLVSRGTLHFETPIADCFTLVKGISEIVRMGAISHEDTTKHHHFFFACLESGARCKWSAVYELGEASRELILVYFKLLASVRPR